MLEASRRGLEDQMVVMAAIERRHPATKEFDAKLNGLIAWLDDFVKRNPKNGK
jgi:hypothetical protein